MYGLEDVIVGADHCNVNIGILNTFHVWLIGTYRVNLDQPPISACSLAM